MAGDLDILAGKWTVWVKDWVWEYEFQPNGRVAWRDLRSAEKGGGSWASSSKLVNIWWSGTATRESWQRPLTASNDRTWYESSYFRGKYRIQKAAGGGPSPAPPAPSPSTTTDQTQIDRAWDASRASLRFALNRLRQLQMQIQVLEGMHARRGTESALNPFRRDIAVISRRLLVPADPMSRSFRDALARAITLIDQNLALPKTLLAARDSGKCANTTPAFAWTTPGVRPPDTELCTSWFNSSDDLKRDVITHEYFHTLGLGDISVNTTMNALGNANTLAQVVALVNDRARQVNSDGHERATPPLPSP